MKSKVLRAFPQVFSLSPNSDYSRFVHASRPDVAMQQNWAGVGSRLKSAIKTVGKDVAPKEKEASVS